MKSNLNEESGNAPATPALIKPRSARVARQLSQLSPGLGHMYLGQLVRGLWFSFGVLVPMVVAVILLLRGCESPVIYLVLLFIAFTISFYSMWDVKVSARKIRPDYRLKDYNKPSAYILMFLAPSVAVAFGVATVIRSEVAMPFKMEISKPGLGFENGEYVLCSKRSYKSEYPKVGDRIVYKPHFVSSQSKVGVVKAVKLADSPVDSLLVTHLDGDALIDEIISVHAIKGKVSFRVWPFSRWGSVTNDGDEDM